MSGHGFHVHGPHDHEIEHATQGHAEHGGSHTNSIAMFTAIIATVEIGRASCRERVSSPV